MRWPYNGERQIRMLAPITLATMTGAGTGGARTIEFRVQTPDSRLQVKTSVLFSPTPPFSLPFDITGMGATFLLLEEDECYGGAFAGHVPLTTIVSAPGGTPLPLPQNPQLMGYSRELVTAADAVHGFLGLNAGAESAQGQWILEVRYQPYGQRLPERDWDETAALCNATLISGPGNF